MIYPKLSDVEPWLLTRIGTSAMHNLDASGYLVPRHTDAPPPPTARRPALSPYVGVTVHRGRYLGQYGPRGAVKTKVFPLTPEGERSAAIARAHALGKTVLERRDGTEEAL